MTGWEPTNGDQGPQNPLGERADRIWIGLSW